MAVALPQGWNIGLRRERERRGWTRAELANKIKAGTHSIYRWEEKGDKPHADIIKALNHLFGKPVEAWGKSIWQMPYRPNIYFTGRERVLNYLHKRLGASALREPDHLPVALSQTRAISGLGGIGKTQTAVEYAYRFREEYDMVVLVHASERDALVAELAALAPLLGLPTYGETNQERLAQAVKRWLETQKEQVWLLIFDNVDNVLLVKEFLPEKGNGAVLLTTRLQAVGKHIHKIDLGTLTQDEGVQFFQRRVGAGEVPEQKVLSNDERQAAAQLYTLLGGLPLALEQAAAYIEEYGCSLAAYVNLYQQQRATFLQMQHPVDRDYPDSVATTWLLSFQRVEQENPDAAHLLHLLAFLHPDAIPDEAVLEGAAELGPSFQETDKSASRLQAAVEILQKYSLIQYYQTARMLSIHRLVQAVIQDRLEAAQARQWAERAVRLVNCAFPDGNFATWERCEQLMPHVLLLTDHLKAWQLVSEEAGHLFHRAGEYVFQRGRYREGLTLTQHALAIRQQVLPPTHPDMAESLNNIGFFYGELGQFREALPFYEQALKIWEQALGPDDPLVALALNNTAESYRNLGRYAEALPLYQRALAIREQALGPNDPAVADYLNNLALLYQAQEHYEQAGQCFQRALKIWEQALGLTHPRLAVGLNNLGGLYRRQGKFAEARQCFQQSQALSEQTLGPDHPDVAQSLYNQAELAQAEEKDDEALSLFQRALTMLEQGLGPDHPSVAIRLNNLANLHQARGRYEEAMSLYQQALAIREQALGAQHPDTAETMHDLARLWEAQGNYEEARSGYERALTARAQAFGAQHPKTEETRQRLSVLRRSMGQHEEAKQLEMNQDDHEPGQ